MVVRPVLRRADWDGCNQLVRATEMKLVSVKLVNVFGKEYGKGQICPKLAKLIRKALQMERGATDTLFQLEEIKK